MDGRRRTSERVRRDLVDGSGRSRRDSGDRDEWTIRFGRQTRCARRCRAGYITSCRPRPESRLRGRPSISSTTTPTTWEGLFKRRLSTRILQCWYCSKEHVGGYRSCNKRAREMPNWEPTQDAQSRATASTLMQVSPEMPQQLFRGSRPPARSWWDL